MVDRVFRYLQGTKRFEIFFNGSCNRQVYMDSNYGGVYSDMCSTSGILV